MVELAHLDVADQTLQVGRPLLLEHGTRLLQLTVLVVVLVVLLAAVRLLGLVRIGHVPLAKGLGLHVGGRRC